MNLNYFSDYIKDIIDNESLIYNLDSIENYFKNIPIRKYQLNINDIKLIEELFFKITGYLVKNKDIKAISFSKIVVEIFPENIFINFVYSNVLFTFKDYLKAIVNYNNIIYFFNSKNLKSEYNSKIFLDTNYFLGLSYLNLERFSKSEEYLLNVKNIRDNYFELNNALDYIKNNKVKEKTFSLLLNLNDNINYISNELEELILLADDFIVISNKISKYSKKKLQKYNVNFYSSDQQNKIDKHLNNKNYLILNQNEYISKKQLKNISKIISCANLNYREEKILNINNKFEIKTYEQKIPSISLCMIVKNEEKKLKECIESVFDIVDEIIIVDTGSKDNTIEIAKEYTSKIYNIDWTNDFSYARNIAIKKCTKDLIFILDADEIIDNYSKSNLLKLLSNYKTQDNLNLVFYFNRLCIYKNYEHLTPRIFENNKNIFYKGFIHEVLHIENRKNVYTNSYILHTGYSEIDESNKINRNIELIQKELNQTKTKFEKVRYLCYLLSHYYLLKKDNSIIENVIEEINNELKRFNENEIKKEVLLTNFYFTSAKYYLENNQINKAFELINNSIQYFQKTPKLLSLYAEILFNLNKFEMAKKILQQCINLGKNGDYEKFTDFVPGTLDYIAWFNIGCCQEKLNNFEEAFESFKKSYKYNNNFIPVIKKLNIYKIQNLEK